MGVIDAFDVGEFGYLAEGTPLKVSGVKHKSTVEVTVEGTEGAAEAPTPTEPSLI